MTTSTQNHVVPTRHALITPSDTANIGPTVAIYVGGTGHISLTDVKGNTVLYSAVPVGTRIPGAFMRVNSTSTTATLIVAQYAQ